MGISIRFCYILELEGGSISVVRKLMSTHHCFFPVLDRNQNPNFFFVLSKKWSLMKTFWFQQLLNGISIFVLYNLTKYVNFPFIYFLFISWYLKLSWLGGVSKLALGDIVVMFVGRSKSSIYICSTTISLLCSICVYSFFMLYSIYNWWQPQQKYTKFKLSCKEPFCQ